MRPIVQALVLGVFAALAGLPARAADLGNAAGLSVEIALPDGVHRFVADSGKDLGDFHGPGFVEENIMVRDPATPLTVFFRPDRDSARVEVVFEWGNMFDPHMAELPGYTARILKNGTELASIEVPKQYWLARWRWQSAPRKIIRTPRELIDAKLVPPYGGDVGRAKPAKPYEIMGISSVTAYMPTTGERGDIGLVPEVTARYLITADAQDLNSMLAWAEASGSAPWHLRDPVTNAPLSYAKYPNASTYYEPRGQSPALYLHSTSPIKIDAAHTPQLAYVPYLLTGDPYYLEELEFALTYTLGCYPNHKTIIRHDQTRTYAWVLRDLFYVIKALPDKTPSWLLPKSYWQAILDKNLKWTMANYVNNPSPKTAIFSSGMDPKRMPFWEEDYLASVLGTGVWLGFEDWRPVFVWKLKSNIARTSGQSGWPRWSPTFYYAKFKTDDGVEAKSWAELAAMNHLADAPNDGINPKLSKSYLAYDRASLVLGVRDGIAEAKAPLEWLNSEMGGKLPDARVSLQ